MGSVYRLLYQLNHFTWNGWALERWLTIGLILLGAAAALEWLPAGRSILVMVGLALGLGFVVRYVARRSDYVHFVAHEPVANEPALTLPALEQVPVYATGRFEVNDETQRFSALAATYTSFAVREHAILARVPPGRFLLVGRWPADQVGMWYIFFRPQAIRLVQYGSLAFGRHARPALRVEIEVVKKSENRQSLRSANKDRVYNDCVYLAFDSMNDCQRVWADLIVDAPAAG